MCMLKERHQTNAQVHRNHHDEEFERFLCYRTTAKSIPALREVAACECRWYHAKNGNPTHLIVCVWPCHPLYVALMAQPRSCLPSLPNPPMPIPDVQRTLA